MSVQVCAWSNEEALEQLRDGAPSGSFGAYLIPLLLAVAAYLFVTKDQIHILLKPRSGDVNNAERFCIWLDRRGENALPDVAVRWKGIRSRELLASERNGRVDWTTDKPDVVSVRDGRLVLHRPDFNGNITLTAVYTTRERQAFTSSNQYTIVVPPQIGVTVHPQLTLVPNQTVPYSSVLVSVQCASPDAQNGAIKFTTADPTIVRINDALQQLTALRAGHAQLQATFTPTNTKFHPVTRGVQATCVEFQLSPIALLKRNRRFALEFSTNPPDVPGTIQWCPTLCDLFNISGDTRTGFTLETFARHGTCELQASFTPAGSSSRLTQSIRVEIQPPPEPPAYVARIKDLVRVCREASGDQQKSACISLGNEVRGITNHAAQTFAGCEQAGFAVRVVFGLVQQGGGRVRKRCGCCGLQARGTLDL